MIQDQFVPPSGAFTRSVSVRFSHCDPAGIVCGERTKAAIAEQRKFSALLKLLRSGLT
jgi:hypothetical protein